MRATELFAIFAFIKSLERIYLAPGFTPSFVGSGVVSVPSLPPVLLNIIPSDFFGNSVEVPALPSVVSPVQVDSLVSVATIDNAPTCVVYISQIARPRFSPAPVIPQRPQPVCLNRHFHPKFEASGPKSLWIIPLPFPPPSKSTLPNPPFCLPTDEPDIESESDNDDDIEIEKEQEDEKNIWLSLLLSPTVLAIVWNFCRLLVHRPIRSSTFHSESVENQPFDSLPWSQPNHDISRRKKVEHRDRVTRPRVFISTLPSLPAGSDTFIITHQQTAECNTLPTVSVPALSSPSAIETSTSPSRPARLVAVTSSERIPPMVVQTKLITSSYALSPVPSSSGKPHLDESVVQPASSPPTPTPALPAARVPFRVPEGIQSGLELSCWAPASEYAPVASLDALESSSSFPACGDAIYTAVSLPTPTPAKKKRVRTRGPKHLRVPKSEFPTVETATQKPSPQSTKTTESLSNSLSGSIWAHKAAETAPKNDIAPMTPIDVSNLDVQGLAMVSTETAAETPSNPTSVSDSIWASRPSEGILEKDNAPIVACPPNEERVSGVQDSMWAVVPYSSLPTPTPAKKRVSGPKHLQAELPTVEPATSECSDVQDLGSSTAPLTIETPSKVSSSLSELIWAPEPTEDVAPLVTLLPSEDKASGLQNSIWPIISQGAEVLEVIAPATSAPVSMRSNPPESLLSQLVPDNTHEASASKSAPLPVKKKRVRTMGPKPLRIQSTQQMLETTQPPSAEVLQTTVEILSESPSSLSGSIWGLNPHETTPADVVVTPLLTEEKASGLEASIWATACDISETIVPSVTLPTPPPSAKKTSSLAASIWADDASAVATLSAPVPVCEEDLLACEQRNDSVSASRWANAPDTPNTPRPFAGRGGATRWKGRRGRGSSRA